MVCFLLFVVSHDTDTGKGVENFVLNMVAHIRKFSFNSPVHLFCYHAGCNDGTQCYKVGDVVQGKCYQAECKLNANKTVVYLDVVRGGKIMKK